MRIGLLGLGEPSFSLRSLFSGRGEMKKGAARADEAWIRFSLLSEASGGGCGTAKNGRLTEVGPGFGVRLSISAGTILVNRSAPFERAGPSFRA